MKIVASQVFTFQPICIHIAELCFLNVILSRILCQNFSMTKVSNSPSDKVPPLYCITCSSADVNSRTEEWEEGGTKGILIVNIYGDVSIVAFKVAPASASGFITLNLRIVESTILLAMSCNEQVSRVLTYFGFGIMATSVAKKTTTRARIWESCFKRSTREKADSSTMCSEQ